MTQAPTLLALFTGKPQTITDERGTWTSSIYRQRIHTPVMAHPEGLEGDQVAQPYHGGPGAAVCVHLMDHYRFWNESYDMQLQPGYVGENFTLDGILESEICAGDIFLVGEAVLQVSGPRIPCANLARRIGRPDWVRLSLRQNRTGFYMRVLQPGLVQAGDTWQLQERLNPAGTIPAINRAMFLEFDPSFTHRMLDMPGLEDWWKEQAEERLSKRQAHWTTELTLPTEPQG
jgi:MOSC domain-containing protein YiiM